MSFLEGTWLAERWGRVTAPLMSVAFQSSFKRYATQNYSAFFLSQWTLVLFAPKISPVAQKAFSPWTNKVNCGSFNYEIRWETERAMWPDRYSPDLTPLCVVIGLEATHHGQKAGAQKRPNIQADGRVCTPPVTSTAWEGLALIESIGLHCF